MKKEPFIEDAMFMTERRGRHVSVPSVSLEHEDDMGNDATSLYSRTGSAKSLLVGSPSTAVCMAPQGPLSMGISFNMYISKHALNEYSCRSQPSNPHEPQCVTNS